MNHTAKSRSGRAGGPASGWYTTLFLLLLWAAATPALNAQAMLFQRSSATPGQDAQPFLNRIQTTAGYLSGEAVTANLEAIQAETVYVPMPEGGLRSFQMDKHFRGNTGLRMWVGRSPAGENRPAADLYLAQDGPYLLAFLDAGADQYWLESIEPVANRTQTGLHWWSHHDPAQLPNDHSEAGLQHLEMNEREVRPDPHGDPGMDPSAVEAAIPDDCATRVLVAYTSGLALTDLNALGRIETSVILFNETNAASQVAWRVELAVVEKVGYNPNAGVGFATALNYFETPGDGVMDEIHTLRGTYDVDMSLLVTENDVDDGCGLASGIGSTSSTAYAVGAIGCIASNLTLAHEFAHLHGCKHDPYVLTLPAGKAHGYVYKPDRWRTVMAYDDECEDAGYDCIRVKHWSNPNTDTAGIPFGTPNSSWPLAATHNNAEKLNENGLSIAAYELRITDKILATDNTVRGGEMVQAEGVSTLTLLASTEFIVRADGRASFRAGDKITIEPGFEARAGSSFSAYLDACVSFPTAREEQLDELAQAAQQLKLFPNPAQTQTRVVFDVPAGEHGGTYRITLLDAFGRTRGQWSGKAASATLTHDIDLTGLPAGFYLVRLEHNGRSAEAALQVIQ